jgi:hypothetical protein
MLALRIASRNSGSSAASIVICVKNTVSFGSLAEPRHQLEALGAHLLRVSCSASCPRGASAISRSFSATG